jgi:hypothetical protein
MRYVCLLGVVAGLVGCSKAPAVPASPESVGLKGVAVKVPNQPTEADIPKLIDLMDDPDPPTRHRAALAIAEVGDPALMPLLGRQMRC